MAAPNTGGNTRKGIPNKIGRMAKENIIEVFNQLGGTAAMTNWARKNKTDFYKLYARLIPTEIVGSLEVTDASELTEAELVAIAAAGCARIIEAASSPDESSQVH